MTGIGDLVTPTGVLVMDAATMRADHSAWLELRRRRPVPYAGPWTAERYQRMGYRIGSSDVPSILDLDGVDTPAHVYADKVKNIRREANEAMEFGHEFEPVIAERWCRLNRSVIDEIGLVAHVDKPWHQSTIDRRVCECPLVKGMNNECGLEVKNVGYSSSQRWGRDIPDRILAQLAHQIFTTGYHHMHYACCVGGNMLKQGVVYRDREADLIAWVVGEVDAYRERYLLAGVEPDWDTSRKAAKLIELDALMHPVRAGELDLDGIGDVMDYAAAAARASYYKGRQENAKARLAQIADGALSMMFSDRPAYRYGPVQRTSVDLDKLLERHPDAYNDPEVVTRSTTYTLYVDKAYKHKYTGEGS